jgi:acyl-CoA thioester hydrolase
MENIILENFSLKTYDKVRYADYDRQGHVNNAVFNQYFETGRVEFLYDNKNKLLEKNATFVIANAKIDYLSEIKWPGTVEIGTAVLKIGNSSITFKQALFQNTKLVATCDCVIVQVYENKSLPLSNSAKKILNNHLLK